MPPHNSAPGAVTISAPSAKLSPLLLGQSQVGCGSGRTSPIYKPGEFFGENWIMKDLMTVQSFTALRAQGHPYNEPLPFAYFLPFTNLVDAACFGFILLKNLDLFRISDFGFQS